LPDGVTYHDPSNATTQDDIMRAISEFENEEIKEGDVVQVGDFTINIEKITKQQLINMRKFLPSEEYRLLKNRKSARLCRRKRKQERGDMQKQLDDL